MKATPVKCSGKVRVTKVARGSKSERDAVVIDIRDGEFLILKRAGRHPFQDELLMNLVGKTIECEGLQVGANLIMESWTEES